MTVAFVKGTQGDDPKYLKLATTLKHYAVNNQEQGRRGLSATVSERMLMEYYLPHFKAGIVEGKATSIMSSYNQINGVINTENPLLLKNDSSWHVEVRRLCRARQRRRARHGPVTGPT